MSFGTFSQHPWDVIVIGGGPAGLMAAGRAAERGLSVLLLEKNDHVGKKLLITGGGRCNLTNATFDTRTLLTHYKEAGKFLFSAFAQYDVTKTLDFFHSHHMPTKTEEHNRVFPASNTAQSVWDVLVTYITTSRVTLRTNATAEKIMINDHTVAGVALKDGPILTAHSYIVATGGKSRPDTGATGDGFRWLKAIGHTIIEPNPSLVPITLKERWISDLAGTILPEVKISLFQNNHKCASKLGRVLFTHTGLSGPTILNLSKTIADLLKDGTVTIVLDLFPKTDHGTLDTELSTDCQQHPNKLFKNILSELIPAKLAEHILPLAHISLDTPCHSLTRPARRHLVHILKALALEVAVLLGADKAIVTSGGVDLTEIDFKTMRSRLYPNLHIIGDLLNIDRPSGGFSLQLCWTTGFVAGEHAGR